jgi:hypothetical protein
LQENFSMSLKVFRSFWFVSLLAVLGVLLWVYASLPEEVVVQEEGSSYIKLSKEVLFYAVLAIIAIMNVLVYVMSSMFKKDLNFRAWFHGLIMTLNIFFIVALMALNTYNSNEKFDFTRIGFMIYGSVGLVVCWAVAWPTYSIFRKKDLNKSFL